MKITHLTAEQLATLPAIRDEWLHVGLATGHGNVEEAKRAISDAYRAAGHRWRAPHSIVGGIKESPGVWGHGGGIIATDVCTRCGCGRHTDTWAQNPENGVQGLTSVRYAPQEFVQALTAV